MGADTLDGKTVVEGADGVSRRFIPMLLPLITRTYEYLGLTRLTTLLELGDVM